MVKRLQNGTKFSKKSPFNFFFSFSATSTLKIEKSLKNLFKLVNYVNFIPFGFAGLTLWDPAGKK